MNLTSPPQMFTISRLGGLRVSAYMGVLLLGVITLTNSVGLFYLTDPSRDAHRETQIKTLMAQIADLKQQVAIANNQPPALNQDDIDATYSALNEKLAALADTQTQMQQTAAQSADLNAVEKRVARLEKQRSTSHRVAAKKPKLSSQPTIQEPSEPPFQVVAIELRGGERFLSIAPTGMTALAQIQLLREGERAGDWQLETLDDHSAVFRVNGQVRRRAVP